MKIRVTLLAALAAAFASAFLWGQTRPAAALSGRVMSAEEGPMEGVLVSARGPGSMTITVVSDAEGRYAFPSSKAQAGRYTIRIRAVGYDLDSPRDVTLTANGGVTADLKLTKTQDLASQLSNSEWLASFPGTEQQKASVRACTHCHTLERVARSRYDVEKLTAVIGRMATYPQLSFPLMIQKLVAARIGGGTTAVPLAALRRDDVLGDADLVINATPVGLTNAKLPIRHAATPRRCLFVDLVYGARPTPFLVAATRAGRRVLDGGHMLLHQGALAFERWTGERAPRAAMARALRDAGLALTQPDAAASFRVPRPPTR